MKRLDQLTFTRFWALLLVLIYHGAGGIYIQAINKFPVSAILYSAPTAVSYLYVLSGFVMSLVYDGSMSSSGEQSTSQCDTDEPFTSVVGAYICT